MVYGLGRIERQGGREYQEDRLAVRAGPDGSWLIAVADDVGGTPWPAVASQAAIDSLPEAIGSRREMVQAFGAAHRAVCDATDRCAERDGREVNIGIAGITTLAVAAWSPEGGLHVAWVGDSLPFVIPCNGNSLGWFDMPSHWDVPAGYNLVDGSHIRSILSWWVGGYRPEIDVVDRPFSGLIKHLSTSKPRPVTEQWAADEGGLMVVLSTDGLYPRLLTAWHPDNTDGDIEAEDLGDWHPDLELAVPLELRRDPQAALGHMVEIAGAVEFCDNVAAVAAVVPG